MNKISANLFLEGLPPSTTTTNSDLKKCPLDLPIPRREKDTHHIWVKRGSNLLIDKIIPVNHGEEDMILNLHLLRRKTRII